MSPGLHATLVGSAAAIALVSAAVCLARNSRALSVRLHTLYGATAAWWLFSMAMVAGAESPERGQYWVRFAQLGIGLLPGVVYAVNAAVAGLQHELRHRIRAHYGLAAVVTLFCLVFPNLLAPPYAYSWGLYPHYTVWGLVPTGAMLLVFAEVIHMYRAAMRRYAPGTPEHARARAFHYGNCFAFLAAVDFLPAFGVPIYPFGFVTVGLMFAATMYGSARYHLIEITPEIAAEHILETMPDGLLVVDEQHRVRIANGAAGRLLGRCTADLVQQPLEAAISDAGLLRLVAAPPSETSSAEEVQFTASDDRRRTVSVAGVPVHDRTGHRFARVWLLHDLSAQRSAEAERNELEGWVREKQKMESLGVMAGGIAHDFNNILMAIMGNAELARFKSGAGEPVADELQTIVTSAEHAAELTDQLLTYAGHDKSVDGIVDLNDLCRDMADLLRSAISKKATIDMDLAATPPLVLGDRSQMRQVILNLVTNASEALADESGVITVRTALLQPGDEDPGLPGIDGGSRSGRRVLLDVVDTGGGMDAETLAKIFDPFFTTKFTGRGLGLAIVFRIVESMGGAIGVTSSPGTGARFQIVLPDLEAGAAPVTAPLPAKPAWIGTGVALLADDEEAVRGVVRSMLMASGFEVVVAADGFEAVEQFRARPDDFAVVVLDITMPGMNGREAAAAIRRLSPTVPVVFISGYTAAAGDATASGDARTVFVHKPFKTPALAAKIREAMALG